MGYAKHVGRVGALAVALGIGTAVITTPGIAWADETGAATNDSPSQNTDGVGEAGAQNTTNTGDPTPGADTGHHDTTPTGGTGTTTTTTTTTQGATTTTVGGGSTPEVTFGGTTVTGSIGAVDVPSTAPPSTAAAVQPIVESSTPSTVEQSTVVSTLPLTTVEATSTATATATVEQTFASLATAASNGADALRPSAEVLALEAIFPAGADAGALTGGGAAGSFAARLGAPSELGAALAANALQDNTINALVATAPRPVPPVPAPSLVDTVLALPGTIIATALNLITQALAPLIGPGAPVDNPVLWAVLAFVRRQFNQGFANSTPVLAPQQTSLGVGPVQGTFGATDADGDALTYAVPTTGVGAPAHGTVTINQAAGTWTYTPTAGYVGEDYFFVTATDATGAPHVHALGQTHLAAARVDVTVTGPTTPNSAPVATSGAITVTEDIALLRTLPIGTDADGDAVTYALGSIAAAHGLITNFNTATGGYTYTPNANYNGPDSFTYTVKDATATSAEATVTVTVTPVNDAPTLSVVQEATDAINGAVKVTITYNDVDDTTLTSTVNPPQYGYFSATAAGEPLEFVGEGTTSVPPGGATIAFYYIPTSTGTEVLTFTLKDPGNLQVTNVLTIVNEVVANQNPVGVVSAADPDEDGNVLVSVTVYDPEGDYVTVFYPAELATGTLTYLDGQDTFDDEEGTFTQYYQYTPYTQSRIDAFNTEGDDFETLAFDFTDADNDDPDYDYDTDDYTTSFVDVTISPSQSDTTPGVPVGPVVLADNGFSYQLFEQANGATVVRVVSPAGSSVTTDALPGTGHGSLTVRPGGDVVVVSTSSAGAEAGFARAAMPSAYDVFVSLISPTGVITSTSVQGIPVGELAVAGDGSAYLTVRTEESIPIFFGNRDRKQPSLAIIRVAPSGTFSTIRPGTVAGETLYADPLSLGGIDFSKSGVIVGADGTGYQGFSGVIIAEDGNSYQTKVGILVIPTTGNPILSALFFGDTRQEVIVTDGIAHMTYRGFDPATYPTTPTFIGSLAVTPTGATTQTSAPEPMF